MTFIGDIGELLFLLRLNSEPDHIDSKFYSKLGRQLCRHACWITVTTFRAISHEHDRASAFGLLQFFARLCQRRRDRRHASGVITGDLGFECCLVDRTKRLRHIDIFAAALLIRAVDDQGHIQIVR